MFQKYSLNVCRIVALICFAGILSFSACIYTDTNQNFIHLTTEQKLSEFEFLCSTLDESYPFWYDIEEAGMDKEELYKIYREKISDTGTDMEYVICLNEFMQEFDGLGHLSLFNSNAYYYYVDATNALDIRPALKAHDLMVLENPVTQNTYRLLDEILNDSRNLKETGSESEENDFEELAPIETAFYDDGETAYLKFESFMGDYKNREAEVKNFFAQIAGTSNLIIDIRGNGGGSDYYWNMLLVGPNAKTDLVSNRYFLLKKNDITWDYIIARGIQPQSIRFIPEVDISRYGDIFSHYYTATIQYPAASNPYRGKIWLLVDDGVYSAAENFTVFCKNSGFATIVGQNTGGEGGISPIIIGLPESGLIFRFSSTYGLNSDGSGNAAYGTIPDVAVSEEEDALEKCLELIHAE